MNQRATEYDLNDAQFEQLMDKYVMTIVDSMSHEDFRQFVINSYYNDFSNYTLSQLLEEIKYTLDDEMLDEFITTIMQLLSRREYNLILRSLDKYELYMNSKEKQLSEDLQDKLYYNLYNPKDGVAQTKVDVSALYDIQTEKDLSEDSEIKSLNFTH